MGRKHCRKRRKCSLQAFLLFPQGFQKASFPALLKKSNLCGKELNLEFLQKVKQSQPGIGNSMWNLCLILQIYVTVVLSYNQTRDLVWSVQRANTERKVLITCVRNVILDLPQKPLLLQPGTVVFVSQIVV